MGDRTARRLGRALGAEALVLTDLTDPCGTWGFVPADVLDSMRLRCLTELSAFSESPFHVAPMIRDDNLLGCVVARGDLTTTSVAAAAGVMAAGLDHRRLSQSRQHIAAANLRTLRAEISPHFLHNALSTIVGYIRSDPERAQELLMDFSDYLRYSFAAKGDLATVAEELEAVETYVQLQQARFGERLDFRMQVEPEILPLPLPFLVVQPLVENAVRHGFESTSATGAVTLRGFAEGPLCHLEIEDDGVGMDPARVERILAGTSTGIGLANVDERLRAVYGPEFGLVVETAPGEGTKVSLRLPRFPRGTASE
ncbi:sensor histidine kinase [Salininema proteolyticum]|uniref:histidine kinase n=1 Tax=Salininema proteolyticum TaxID=1607685 RepID=A0ABV8TTB0_9ACTN